MKRPLLEDYAKVFNSVEGNTSFYHVPDRGQLQRWMEAVPDGFRFCFKFHQGISHHQLLDNVNQQTLDFLRLFSGFEDKLGCLMLQLPARFGPAMLPRLAAFLQGLPTDFQYGVEVRHPAFFEKGDAEVALNRLLLKHGVNRIMMDTRGLFACADDDGLIGEVKQKKPRLPVNVIATGQRPVIRFVGHPEIAENAGYLRPWMQKLSTWLDQGKQPFMFFHMPDNGQAPLLARQFFRQWPQAGIDVALSCPNRQASLF